MSCSFLQLWILNLKCENEKSDKEIWNILYSDAILSGGYLRTTGAVDEAKQTTEIDGSPTGLMGFSARSF